MPVSVSGCLNNCRMILGGAVITSAPIFAASTTCIGLRTRSDQDFGREIVIVVDHADVGDQLHAVEADIVVAADERRDEGRARLGGEQGLAAEKHKVTLTIVPSLVSALQVLRPSAVSGTLIAILSAIFRSTSASRIMPHDRARRLRPRPAR